MGKKEKLQKELDLILDKLRFWRYVLFAIVSGVIGVLFGLSQHKIHLNWGIIFLLFLGFIGVILSIKRIGDLTSIYDENLKLLEKED